jgi:RNA polymerase sigma-70 factor, ECF subfamily
VTQPRSDSAGAESQPAAPSPDASQAFDALVRAHYGKLCGFAYRLLGSREMAEDAVHDVFLHVWQGRERFDFRDPLAYLYRAVRNRIISDRRHHLVHDRVVADIGEMSNSAPDAADDVEGEELARAAARAVETLPPRCRLVFTMRREQGLSYAEIAQVLDISVKTVENQMTRAAKLLRARLAGYLSLTLVVASTAVEAWRRVGA